MNESEQNYLSNIDGTVGLAGVPTGFVNLVLTDPPYGIADKTKLTKVGSKIVSTHEAWGNDFQDKWANIDAYWDWFKPFVAEYVRVLKEGGSVILFLDRKYTGLIAHYIERDFGLIFKNKIYFKKKNPMPGIRKTNYRSSIEEAIWFSKPGKQTCFNFGLQAEMTQVYEGAIGQKKTKHPTEKYRWMIEPLIKNHSNEGDVILDNFAGSGSVLVYAKLNKRNAIGFEKSSTFFDMAKERCLKEQLEFDFR